MLLFATLLTIQLSFPVNVTCYVTFLWEPETKREIKAWRNSEPAKQWHSYIRDGALSTEGATMCKQSLSLTIGAIPHKPCYCCPECLWQWVRWCLYALWCQKYLPHHFPCNYAIAPKCRTKTEIGHCHFPEHGTWVCTVLCISGFALYFWDVHVMQQSADWG